MDWTRSSAPFIRTFAAVLLFADPKNLRRNRRGLGAVLLQLRAAGNHGWPLFHAGHAIARAFNHCIVFLPTLDRVRAGPAFEIGFVFRERVLHFTIDFNQIAERGYQRATRVSRFSAFQIFNISAF